MATVDSGASGRPGSERPTLLSPVASSGDDAGRWRFHRRADLERSHRLRAALDSLAVADRGSGASGLVPPESFWSRAGSSGGGPSELLWLSADDQRLMAGFTAPGLAGPPPGWSLADDGRRAWQPAATARPPSIDRQQLRRFPAVVTVAEGLMVNLAAARPLAVIGPRPATDAVIRSIVYGLVGRCQPGPMEVVASPGLCPSDLEPLISTPPSDETARAGSGRGPERQQAHSPVEGLVEVFIDVDRVALDRRQSGSRSASGEPVLRILITGSGPRSSPGLTLTADTASVTLSRSPAPLEKPTVGLDSHPAVRDPSVRHPSSVQPRFARDASVRELRAEGPTTGEGPVSVSESGPGSGRQGRLWAETPDPDRPSGPVIRLLGRIELVGADWPLTSQQLSLLAFLACAGSANRTAIVDALWDGQAISQSRFPNLLAEVRAKIGRHHLPDAVAGRYQLEGIETDVERFEAAVGAAGRAASAEAGTSNGFGANESPSEDRDLIDALELVRGPPLTAPGGRYWSWVEDRTDLSVGIEAMIVDAAHGLAVRARLRNDVELAARACQHGLAACPLDENLVTLLAQLHLDVGRINSAHRLVDGWESKVRRLGCGEPSGVPRALLRATPPATFGSSAA